jgi:hypothetical protein
VAVDGRVIDRMTLPGLQSELDRLAAGDRWELSQADYLSPFGEDEAALARLESFAREHCCEASVTASGVEFRRLKAGANLLAK